MPAVPALAALFDAMTTHVQSQRFTAAEALQFYNTQIATVPSAVLDSVVEPHLDWSAMVNSDVYWSKLTGRFRRTAKPKPCVGAGAALSICFPNLDASSGGTTSVHAPQ